MKTNVYLKKFEQSKTTETLLVFFSIVFTVLTLYASVITISWMTSRAANNFYVNSLSQDNSLEVGQSIDQTYDFFYQYENNMSHFLLSSFGALLIVLGLLLYVKRKEKVYVKSIITLAFGLSVFVIMVYLTNHTLLELYQSIGFDYLWKLIFNSLF